MAINTRIEYCHSTINPTPVCGGCKLYHKDPKKNHCYAADMVRRYAGLKGWPKSFTEFELFSERISQACGWPDLTGKDSPDKPWLNGMPRVIFLNDMGDSCSLIHPLDWAYPYIEMMERSPHIWLWLTKWPERMYIMFGELGYVPENFWLGTTVTDPETIKRVSQLITLKDFGAQMLWLSLEPLLKSVDVTKWLNQIDWVAYGGESMSNARPSQPGSFVKVRESCLMTKTPQFFKQWGEHLPAGWNQWGTWLGDELVDPSKVVVRHGTHFARVGKKRAGRRLQDQEWVGTQANGREWSEMPEWRR